MSTLPVVLLCLLLLVEQLSLGQGSAGCIKYTNISVSDVSPSADMADCLAGRSACRTLEYALSNVTNCTYVRVDRRSPLVVTAPVYVGNVYGLVVAGDVNQRVECREGVGVVFQAVSDVHILGLYWSQCSIRPLAFGSSPHGNEAGASGIFFIESSDITVKDSTFTSSYGTGLSLYNVGGTVTIQNCSFVNNTIAGCVGASCIEDRQGLHIEFGCHNNACGSLNLHNSNALLTLENNTFSLNTNPYSELQRNYTANLNGGVGGGLAVVIGGNSVNNTVVIKSCTFENNSAVFGAGLAIVMTGGAKSNEVIISESCKFSYNSATEAGGGMLLVLSTSTSLTNNSVKVSASFISNSASLGGGMACFSGYQPYPTLRNSLIITQSAFSINRALRGGSAFSLVTPWTRADGGYSLLASIDRSNITYNSISALSPSFSSSSVVGLGTVYLELSSLVIGNAVQFNWNIGTALFLSSSFVTLRGQIGFENNYAINGAAVHLSGVSWLTFTRGLQLYFKGNYALQYGGCLYQDFPLPGATGEWWNCMIQYENSSILIQDWAVNVTFLNNSAQKGGPSIYVSNPEGCIRDGDNPPFTNSLVYNFLGSNAAEQVTNPPNMLYFNQSSASVWMGQTPQLYAYASSYFNQTVTGTVLAAVDYKGSNQNLSLGGNTAIQLNKASPNEFYLAGPLYDVSGNNSYTSKVIIYSTQQPSSIAKLTINVTQCPFGCPYNTTVKTCQCQSNSAVQCENNVCCIKYGYWYGNFTRVSGADVYEGDVCPRGFCSYNGNGLCPENAKCPFLSGYCKLPETENDICANNRGGAFCSYCADGNSFTYAGIKCVEDRKCSPGYKALLVLIIFLYWAVLTAIVIFALKFKFRVGSGRLYCVLYYFSIINYFVGNNYPTAFLQVTVDVITGIILLPRFLGSIDLCVSKGMLPLQIVALNYIHPLFFLLLVFAIIITAHYSKQIANLKSTSQAVCLLILLSHTSLVETSITILRPVSFSDLEEGYVAIQPETPYFDPPTHLSYAVIAIVVLLINIPLSLFLLLAPWLTKFSILKMDRIKPILDEFQGCYKDEYRSFAGFYLLVRELIFLVSSFPGLKVYGAIYTYQWISIIVVIIHAMVQPYKEKWLNILDTILLANLVAVSLLFGGTAYTLFGQNNQSRNFHVFLVHIFVLTPITYATILGLQMLATQLWIYIKKHKSATLNKLSQVQLQVSGECSNGINDSQSARDLSGNQSQTLAQSRIGEEWISVNNLDDRRDSVIFHLDDRSSK